VTQKIIVYSKAKYCIVSLVSNKTTKTTTKMKTKLTVKQIEAMFQNGMISEMEYLDLLKKYIALREKAMNGAR
jgi:hypothetical protein